MLKNWIQHIIRNSDLYVICVLIITIFLSAFITIPKVDGQLKGLNIEDTKYYKSGQKIAEYFNMEEFIEVKVSPKSTRTVTVFNSLDLIEKKLSTAMDGLELKSIHQASSMFDGTNDSTATITTTLEAASKIPILGDLISHDRKSFLLVVKLGSTSNLDLNKFDSILSRPYEGIQSLKSMSIFHVEHQIARSLEKDILSISLVLLILISGLILYIFRDLRALAYVTTIVVISILPIFFFFTVLNIQLNIITALAIPVLIVLSLADSIHLLTGYFNAKKEAVEERIEESMKAYATPSLLTSITTTVAFASFLLNSAESIQNFGLLISITVLPAFVLTYAVTPFFFRLIPIKTLPKHGVNALFKFLDSNRKAITYILIFIALLSLPLTTKLSYRTDFDSFIPKGTEIDSNRTELSNDFHSQLAISILIENDSTRTKKNTKEIEKDILKIVDSLEALRYIGSVKSIKDQILFKRKYGLFGGFIHIPNKDNPYRSADRRTYRIEIRVSDIAKIELMNHEVESILKPYDQNYDYAVFSKALLVDEINQSVAHSLLKSLLFSFIFIFVCFVFLTKSLITTLISIAVNLVPLTFILPFFYFGNFDLNILTAITVVVCLGIIVDDTIHVIYRKIILQKQTDDLGFGIITTSILLVVGFLTFSLSSFQPSQEFGIISAFIFLITMIADLTMLPYLLDLVGSNSTSIPLKKADD